MWTLGIQDKNLLTIISKMLKAKIKMPNGQIIENEKGTPQGGILSPCYLISCLMNLTDGLKVNRETFPTLKDYTQYGGKENRHSSQ